MKSQFALLRTRRFWPLFVAQFLGAFNDNLFKNALVILISYRIGSEVTDSPALLVTLAAGIFILPFFLFSATAGELADKYDKAGLIRRIKLAEVGIMALGVIGLVLGDLWFLFAVLFLMGTQSAFFGPLKYGILPDHLTDDELMGGNALIETATFLAILLGTVAGGILVLREGGVPVVASAAVALAMLGYAASRFIPPTVPADPTLRLSGNIALSTRRILAQATTSRDVLAALLGISWFWFVGATFLAQFPNLVNEVLGADETVVVLFLVLFAIGIGLGSLLCNVFLRGRISPRLLPWAAGVLGVAAVDFYFAAFAAAEPSGHLRDAAAFLDQMESLRLLLDLLLISAAGGVFVVPLYAFVQARTEQSHRARVIAALNVLNSAFMVASALLAVALLGGGVSVPLLLAGTGALTIPVGLGLKPLLRSG